ncbi:MAG: hypothetical protein J3Q66DRAFT_374408 [Benniella sp.]|nr:MAG: hypothetical protein J3Q66DRAFT_374408 [Benniella sp.]
MRATTITTTAILWLGGIASTALLIVNAGVTCKGVDKINVNFTPGVTFTKRSSQVFAGGKLGVCQSAEFPGITGGTLIFGGDAKGRCTGPLAGESSSAWVDIRWSDGTRSTASQMSFNVDLASWSFNGVLKGQFEGQTVRANGRATKAGFVIGDECLRREGLTDYPATLDSLVVG